MNTCPAEIKTLAFSYLPLRELKNVRLVSKDFRECVQSHAAFLKRQRDIMKNKNMHSLKVEWLLQNPYLDITWDNFRLMKLAVTHSVARKIPLRDHDDVFMVLKYACHHGVIKFIEWLINHDVTVPETVMLLRIAIQNNNYLTFKKLIKLSHHGDDAFRIIVSDHATELATIAIKRHDASLLDMVFHNVDAKLLSRLGCIYNDVYVIRKLADPRENQLYLAVICNAHDVVFFLLENLQVISVIEPVWKWCIRTGHLVALKILVDKFGLEFCAEMLDRACKHGEIDIMHYLIQQGVTSRDAMYAAVDGGNVETVQVLHLYGYALPEDVEVNHDVALYLLQHKIEYYNKYDLMKYFCKNGSVDAIECLIKRHNFDFAALSTEERDMLGVCCVSCGKLDVVKLLEPYIPLANPDNIKKACRLKAYDIAAFLIQKSGSLVGVPKKLRWYFETDNYNLL